MATMAEQVVATESREQQADALVRRFMYWSAGFGILPAPGVDVLLIGGAQLNMLRKMSHLYGMEFSDSRGKAIISALAGGLGTPLVAYGAVGRMIKMVPIVGPMFGAVAMPVTAAAFTYAIGKVFIQHFEAGGTFLNFDPEKVKVYFKEQYAEGKRAVEEVVGGRKPATAK